MTDTNTTDGALQHLGELAQQDHEMLQARIGHLRLVMRECIDAIHDNDLYGAIRMLEVALRG